MQALNLMDLHRINLIQMSTPDISETLNQIGNDAHNYLSAQKGDLKTDAHNLENHLKADVHQAWDEIKYYVIGGVCLVVLLCTLCCYCCCCRKRVVEKTVYVQAPSQPTNGASGYQQSQQNNPNYHQNPNQVIAPAGYPVV